MKLSFILFTLFLSTTSFSKVRIVSDFDDTIKRSNIVDGGYRTVGNASLAFKPYYDIPPLYIEMEKESNGLYVLSASPSIIKPLIKWTLKSYEFPYVDVFTRSWYEIGSERRKIKYKVNRIESVLKGNSDKLILLGDNIEADHNVYMKVAKRNPGRISEIYIRKVIQENLPEGIIGFFSAFEIAAHEYSKGRLNYKQVEKVAKVILNTEQEDLYRIIPYYGECPTLFNEFNLPLTITLAQLESKVMTKITEYCKIRHQFDHAETDN
jgi:hypothetical protein